MVPQGVFKTFENILTTLNRKSEKIKHVREKLFKDRKSIGIDTY